MELLKNIWDISNIFGILQKCLGYLKNIWDIWWQDGGRYWKQIVALSPRLLRGDGRGGGIGECKERPGVSKRGCFLFVFICGQIASKCPFLHERCHHQAFAGVHLHGGEEVGEVNLFP